MKISDMAGESFFSEALAQKIYTRRAEETVAGRGTVLVLHGLGDHSGRHGWIINLLLAEGFGVFALDWPGNGRSDGIRGNLPTIGKIEELLREVLEAYAIKPTGLIGHSTGGFLSLPILAKRPDFFSDLRWVWFSSPLLAPKQGQSQWKIDLAHRLSKLLPKLTFSTGVKRADCFELESIALSERILISQGVHNRISLSFAVHIMGFEAELWRSIQRLPTEYAWFITQGSDDTVCPAEFSEKLFREIPGDRKKYLYAHGAHHEPFREPHPDGFINAIRHWIRKELS